MRGRLVPHHRHRFDGWIEQQRLWGVYADEKVD